MPSVGMRRTTRVFGGARVLRSGRRLWPESGETKHKRGNNDGDEWYPHSPNKKTSNGWAHDVKTKQEVNNNNNNNNINHINSDNKRKRILVVVDDDDDHDGKSGGSVDRMFGNVYMRKRKRLVGKMSEFSGDKMFGIHFSRRQRRDSSESLVGFTEIDDSWELFGGPGVFYVLVVNKDCFSFSCFLNSVLRYLRRERLELAQLAAFLLSQPINGVYSSQGIRFLWDPPINCTGICTYFGVRRCIPVFSVDFSAVPLCFMHMHRNMLLRLESMQLVLVNKLLGVHTTGDVMDESEEDEEEEKEDQLCVHLEGVLFGSKVMEPEVGDSGNRAVLHPSVRASKLAGRNSQYRNGLNSRSIQKRRSSLRMRRARNPSLVGIHKAKGALVSDLISSKRNGVPFSSVVSKKRLRSSIRSSSAATFKELSSTVVGLTQDVGPYCCSANILIIESNKCYREKGVSVMLEISASREWLLVVKKDGLTRYTHKAEQVMRPPACNRFTHAIIWTADDSWKLEFPDRQDWFVFKDLYNKCSDWNVPASIAKVIPVPGVREVSGYDDVNTACFHRPDFYILINGDEVSRALAKRTANYDMDSEDEEWLNKFNNEFFAENELHEHVSVDNFELMVDAFEKACYCSQDDFTNEKAAVDIFLELGRREVVEAVFSYWMMKKRKHKRSALLRVFQGQQVKRTSLIPKPALRKRRSFKRQTSQSARGKPRMLQAMAAEQDALDEQNAMLKVEEAKVSANRSIESAIWKRHRAQVLMENADLAIYKATMALRIAEAAQLAESSDAAVAHFFD